MLLEKFRLFGATKAAKALLFLLIFAFAAWGIESFLQAQRSPHGLTVNGQPVTLLDLENQLRLRTRQLEQMLGGPLAPEQRQGLQLGEQIVDENVARLVLQQTASGLHLQPATRRLQEEIAAMPAFHNEVGQFDAERYRSALAQVGRTPGQFERDLMHDLSVRNLTGLLSLAPLPAALAAPQVAAAGSTLTLQVAKLTPRPTDATPTPAQLEDFYRLNPKTYEVPEHRSGLVLELSAATLSNTLTIPEARIMQEYEANRAAYSQPETRLVRHILLPTLNSATALQQQIKSVTDFATLANQVSTDPGNQGRGGSLGYIRREEVVPGFANMAFSLPVAQLSSPVQTPFGWHLIWVEAISPATLKPLAAVREDIRQALVAQETQTVLEQLVTRVDDALAGGQTLREVATAEGLKLRALPRVRADDEATDPALLQALFNTPLQTVSPPITLPDGGLAYLETTQLEPAAQPPLAEVRARVLNDWRALQTELSLKSAAEALIGAARAPATGQRSLAEAAQQAQVQASFTTLTVNEANPAPRWLQPRLQELLAASPGTTLPTAVAHEEALQVVQLISRQQGPAPADPTAAQQALANAQREDLEGLLMSHLLSQARVTCEAAGLQQVFGYAVPCRR